MVSGGIRKSLNLLVCSIIHIKSIKLDLDSKLVLQKVHRIIEFNQEAWLKPYIDMNTELKKKTKNDFEQDFFKLMNNSVFEDYG